MEKNRAIKFRGKIKEKGISECWIEGSLIHITRTYKGEEDEQECDIYQIINEDGAGFFIDKDTIGQYTGLKDKNGKEIYEGDIIHIPENWEEYGWASGENYEIDFKDGRFRLKPKYKPNATGYDLEFTNEIEVIGNIYDNPELLEV